MKIRDMQIGKKYKFETRKGASYIATYVRKEKNKETYFQFEDGTIGCYDNDMIIILEEVEGEMR